ncbi:MAG: hypothetical protein IJ202_05475, partial [Bacteroidales bacterium]|nr:hypothetical protein [Bacteroidales bacterium]
GPDFGAGYVDFGARQYSPILSRWLVPDPMGEKYYGISPYAYCAGNPVVFKDDGGADIVLAGSNKSSVTIVTDLIDVHVNLSRFGVDWGGQHHLQGNSLISSALDIVGLFDQSGTADVINAQIQFDSGENFAGLMSLASAVPAFGDAAKLTRIGKDFRILNDAIAALDSGAKLTKSLRSNMVRELERAGKLVPEGMQAHHVLPKKFFNKFDNAGININDPQYGVWMESHHHLSKAWQYNMEWKKFFGSHKNPTIKEIEEEAKRLMKTVYDYDY